MELKEALAEQNAHLSSRTDQHFSTFVWICSVSHSKSKVTVVNIRSNPGEVLDSFFIRTHLLCIASVPGAKTADLLGSVDVATLDETTSPELRLCARRKVGILVATPSTPASSTSGSPARNAAQDGQDGQSSSSSTSQMSSLETSTANRSKDCKRRKFFKRFFSLITFFIFILVTVTFNDSVEHIEQPRSLAEDLSLSDVTLVSGVSSSSSATLSGPIVPESGGGPSRSVTLEKLSEYVAYTQPPSPLLAGNGGGEGGASSAQGDTFSDDQQQPRRAPSAASSLPVQAMSTRLPTMWLGGQNGVLYVHSGIAQWSHCIATIHLPDSVLQIVHYRGRVFVALANGQCCIFVRSEQTGKNLKKIYFVSNL